MVEMAMDSLTVADTHTVAERLADITCPGDVVALHGELGVGKTTFTQGFAKALGVLETVNSPTFTLIKEYEGRIPLYHMDLYRLGNESEAWELGLEEYFDGEGVCVVEWPERLGETLPAEAVQVTIEQGPAHERRIRIRGQYGRGRARVKELSLE